MHSNVRSVFYVSESKALQKQMVGLPIGQDAMGMLHACYNFNV